LKDFLRKNPKFLWEMQTSILNEAQKKFPSNVLILLYSSWVWGNSKENFLKSWEYIREAEEITELSFLDYY